MSKKKNAKKKDVKKSSNNQDSWALTAKESRKAGKAL